MDLEKHAPETERKLVDSEPKLCSEISETPKFNRAENFDLKP